MPITFQQKQELNNDGQKFALNGSHKKTSKDKHYFLAPKGQNTNRIGHLFLDRGELSIVKVRRR